jgi:GT2 family glycosyltransferase
VVTAVVLNYINGRSMLLPCLRHLLRQHDLPSGGMEVLVVHNPPDWADRHGDDWATVRAELEGEEFRRVRVIENPTNEGFAGGHNVAFREVRTEFVAIVNSDARPGPTWLAELLKAFEGETGRRVGAATSKLVFLSRYLPVTLSTAGFVPAEHDPAALDTRELGVRVHEVRVNGHDVTDDVIWGEVGYDREQAGREWYRWTRPRGTMLVPVDPGEPVPGPAGPLRLTLRLGAEAIKPVELSWPGGAGSVKSDADSPHVQPTEDAVEVPAGAGLVDVVNNAGSMVDAHGNGTDLGFRRVDRGQYDRPADVFAFCGAAVCFRTSALRDAGLFDEDFFLYYEDTDLAWRLWTLGWRVRYVPGSVARHKLSATLGEESERRRFYVERNRLLTVTKNARAGLTLREVLGFLLGTGRDALAAVLGANPRRRRQGAPRSVRLRLRVARSYLGLLPSMLRRRRQLARRAVVPRRHLRHWEVPWPGPRER